MRSLAIMIKPASSLCNLRCKYCFYEDVSEHRAVKSHGIMDEKTMKKILRNIFCCMDTGDQITFAFQGGEPTLAGLAFFCQFVSAVRELNCGCEINYQLQTNGMLLDEEWCEFLKRERFLVGLSVDGTKEIHDKNRVDRFGNGSFEHVMAAKRLLERYGVSYNALMTLTNEMAGAAEQVWKFIMNEGFEYVQFTPCIGALEGGENLQVSELSVSGVMKAEAQSQQPEGKLTQALRPEMFAKFYTELFSLWSEDWRKGNRIVVKLFDDLITLLAVRAVTACGLTGTCTPQIIVESNGDVFPCDFYALDKYRVGNLCEDTIKAVYESPKQLAFLRIPHANFHLCRICRFRRICGGNCKRMQEYVCYGPEDERCGYQQFLENAIQGMAEAAEEIIEIHEE